METIKAKEYDTREALEDFVVQTFGKTPTLKEAIISGKEKDLRKLSLAHGGSVWGVVAHATDYKAKKAVPRVRRGRLYPSTLNGRKIK